MGYWSSYVVLFVVVLLSAFLPGGSLAHGQGVSEADPKKPRSFEDYTPRSLKEIAMKPDPKSLRDQQDGLSVTADDDEAWPSLGYLRHDYRSVSVVAHVLVHEAEVVKKVGGYEDWRVGCEVVEPFKGKFRPGERIEYYHGAEARLRKDWFDGEKIVFLLHRYYEPEKRWIYAVLENSTLPYTKDRVEKLRLIQRSLQPRGSFRPTAKTSRFEKLYMPRVGRKITVEGVLEVAKLGLIVTFDNSGIYIYPVDNADTSKMNAFDSLKGQTVRVTGTLRQSRGSSASRAGEVSIPEHFFFDAAEVKVVRVR